MRAGWAVVMALACAACNEVFGLTNTNLIDANEVPNNDRDLDGIANDVDNCPNTYNPLQEDGDHDGFGDACDFCPTIATATNHDEDGDRAGDVCDNCPDVANFQGVDSDGDGLGDACDPPTAFGLSQRVRFDSFETLGAPWQSSVAWTADGDEVAPPAALTTGELGLVAPSVQLTQAKGSISATFVSRMPWQVGDRFGVAIIDASNDMEIVSCIVLCVDTGAATPTCKMALRIYNQTFVGYAELPSPSMHVILRWDASLPKCFSDVQEVQGTAGFSGTFYPSLIGAPSIAVGAVDVLR